MFIAGGVESMSRAPFVMLKPEEGFARGAPQVADSVLGWRFVNPRFAHRHTISLGETAEVVADRWCITREDQDAFAVESQRRAAATTCADVSRKPSGEITTPLPVERPVRRWATDGSSRSLAVTTTREYASSASPSSMETNRSAMNRG